MGVAFEEGDVPLYYSSEAFVVLSGFGGAGIEYFDLDLAALGEQAEDRGVVLDRVGGEDGEFFQGWRLAF